MFTVLLLLILIPVFGSLVVLALRDRGVRPLAVLFALATLGLGLWAVVNAFPRTVQYTAGGMPWIQGLRRPELFGMMLDPLSSLMLVVITGIGLLTVLYSTGYLSPRNKEHPSENGQSSYYFWLLLFLGTMVGVAVSPNLLQLFVFLELTTLCSWALIAYHQDEKSLAAGFKALIITHGAGVFFAVAIFILFINTGSFDFAALRLLPAGLKTLVFLFLLIAAWAKAAQLPFNTWLPDAMAAPTPISAYLHAAAMVKAGVYLMARVVAATWAIPTGLGLVMAVMALLTMIMALVFYMLQDDLKRLLAFSTIAHLAYVMLGVALGALGSELAFRGGMLHIINHAFTKCTLFLSVGVVAWSTGTRSISQLSGLGRKFPLVGLAFLVGALAVTGVPPLACFWSKFYILSGAIRLSGTIGPIVVGLVILESAISFAWMVYVGQRVFLGQPTSAVAVSHNPIPWTMMLVLAVLVIMCVLAPLVGVPLVAAQPLPAGG